MKTEELIEDLNKQIKDLKIRVSELEEDFGENCINIAPEDLPSDKNSIVGYKRFTYTPGEIRCFSSSRIIKLTIEIWSDGRLSYDLEIRNGSRHSVREHNIQISYFKMLSGHQIKNSSKNLTSINLDPKQTKTRSEDLWWNDFLEKEWSKIEAGAVPYVGMSCRRIN